jgi:xylulokinase
VTGEHLLGIDLGAGSLKATLMDPDGHVLAQTSALVAAAAPRPGWSEQDPHDWWRALVDALRALWQVPAASADAVAAVAVSGGAHIAVLEDAAGRVLRPSIMWNDQRSAAQAAALRERCGPRIEALGFNRANPTWTLCHLAWLREQEPQCLARCARLFLAKDHLRHRLTGDWCTDPSDAIGTLLYDAGAGAWSPELCALVGLDPAVLPPIRGALEVAGGVHAQAAAATGLRTDTPVVVGANDTTVELFGAGAVAPGQGAIKLATAGVVYLSCARPEVHPPVSCYPHLIPGMWYMASGINACASAHRWVRDVFFAELDPAQAFDEMDRLAATVAPGCDGLLFHPYLMGERAPHWDADLRGDFVGLSLHHTRAHFARACYEGIALALHDALRSATSLSGARFADMRVLGGGARSALWRQILADVTGLAMHRPRHADASFASAIVAGLGLGLFEDPGQAVARCVEMVDTRHPDPARQARYAALFEIYDRARAALTPVSHSLTANG